MEYVEQQNIKKLCNFYVSELHLSVMLLPYISKQINEDVEITTIFEKLEKNKFKKVLEKLNVKNKEEILAINWFNSNENTDEQIKNSIEKSIKNNKKVTIIIGGNKKYILENNIRLQKMLNNNEIKENVKIIDCYNIEEIGIEMKEIVKNYDAILNTSGEITV